MIYREYGKTGKKVSAVGFGGMRFDNPDDREASVGMMLYALERGINYFDTAPNYLFGKSEEIFGEAVPVMRKTGKEFFVSTKSSARKPAGVRKDLEKSLKRMGLDYVGFFHVWCVLSPEDFGGRKAAGVLDEFRKIKEEGLASHITVSTHMGGSDIRKMLEEESFEGMTVGYSAINFPFREEGISAASEQGMGVVIMNPLGGGTIVNNPDTFSFIRVREDQSMVDGALHFLLSDSRITTALVGFGSLDHVKQAADAAESLVPYSEEQIEGLKNRIQSDFQNLCTTCGYCNICPEDIRVWTYMEAYNHTLLSSPEKAADRLKWHWNASINDLDKCIECRKCEDACTQHLPILERFGLLKEEVRRKN